MGSTSGNDSGERRLSPTDAFSLLGESARVDIVTALHRASSGEPVSFSALYDRTDVDGSAKFNYHLGELVGHFVTKSEDGYTLSSAGRRVARAVAAGRYTDVPAVGPVGIEGVCHTCGGRALVAVYEDERFKVRCEECDGLVLGIQVPPSLARGREPAAFVDAVERWARVQVETATEGLCPDCGGTVEPHVVDDVRDSIAFDAVAAFQCQVCGRRTVTSFGAIAAQNEPVQRFHRRRDASLDDRRYWEIEPFITGDCMDIVSEEPWRVVVEFTVGGECCVVTLDGDLAVVDVTIDAVTDD